MAMLLRAAAIQPLKVDAEPFLQILINTQERG
jgi:hypothetical protein